MATGYPLIDNSPSTSRRGDARILYSILQSPSCLKLSFLKWGKEEKWIRMRSYRERRWEVWSIRSSCRLRWREPSSIIYNKLLNFNYTASPTFSTRNRCYKAADQGWLTGLFNKQWYNMPFFRFYSRHFKERVERNLKYWEKKGDLNEMRLENHNFYALYMPSDVQNNI